MNEENQEQNKKFRFTNKVWFYIGGLAGLLLFIGASAWWDLTFGSFDPKAFIADTLILVAISLAAMVLSDLFSQEVGMNKFGGVYNIAQNDYLYAFRSVESIKVYFSQWFFWFLDQETKRKREGHLMLHGIDGTDAKKIVRYATLGDIERMKNSPTRIVKELDNGSKVVLPNLDTEEKIKAVTDVLNGKLDVKTTNYSIYLFMDDVSEANMSTLERQEYLEVRRKKSKKRAYIMRITMLILTSALMAALIPDPDEAGSASKKWWAFMKRLGVFVTSFLSGWLAGTTDIVARAAQIRDKTDKLETFKDHFEKGLWKPIPEEELDKRFIEAYEKEQEEAKKAVIVPEPVNTPLLENSSQEIHQNYTKNYTTKNENPDNIGAFGTMEQVTGNE